MPIDGRRSCDYLSQKCCNVPSELCELVAGDEHLGAAECQRSSPLRLLKLGVDGSEHVTLGECDGGEPWCPPRKRPMRCCW